MSDNFLFKKHDVNRTPLPFVKGLGFWGLGVEGLGL